MHFGEVSEEWSVFTSRELMKFVSVLGSLVTKVTELRAEWLGLDTQQDWDFFVVVGTRTSYLGGPGSIPSSEAGYPVLHFRSFPPSLQTN